MYIYLRSKASTIVKRSKNLYGLDLGPGGFFPTTNNKQLKTVMTNNVTLHVHAHFTFLIMINVVNCHVAHGSTLSANMSLRTGNNRFSCISMSNFH